MRNPTAERIRLQHLRSERRQFEVAEHRPFVGHNANVKAAWGRIDPRILPGQNQFTVQLQLFYF